MKKKNEVIWSTNWCIDEGIAWFIDGQRDTLFHVDLESMECEYVAKLPNLEKDKYLLNPLCIKIGNKIFCMPDKGSNIWIYDIKKQSFKKIAINNQNKTRFLITDFWEYENRLVILSRGLKKIIEIDADNGVITNYYTICDDIEEELAKSIKVGSDIYCVSTRANRIYQFNLISKNTIIHTISGIEGGINTICFDGDKFWMSGCRKEIYIWEKKNNSVEILRSLPDQFGIYNFEGTGEGVLDCEATVYNTFAFCYAVIIGQNVWFIPSQTNKIVYVDKDTYQIFDFVVEMEEETRESLSKNDLAIKYYPEYVSDNRYIGLFSVKNRYILEIDALKLKSKVKSYVFSNNCFQKFIHDINMDRFCLQEKNEFDRFVFEKALMERKGGIEKNSIKSKLSEINDNKDMGEMTLGKKIYFSVL